MTSYNYETSKISCTCSTIGPYLYHVVNDLTNYSDLAPLSVSVVEVEVPEVYDNDYMFQGSSLAIIILLILLILIFPILAVVWDRADYNYIKTEVSLDNDEVLNKFAFYKGLALEQVIYHK